MNLIERNAFKTFASYLKSYLEEGNGTFLGTRLSDFYSTNPTFKGLINKRNVTNYGSEYGLYWKSNAPLLDDEIILKRTSPQSASSTKSEGAIKFNLDRLRKFILSSDSPNEISTDKLILVYNEYPDSKGYFTKANISTHGDDVGLGWKAVGVKNYITVTSVRPAASAVTSTQSPAFPLASSEKNKSEPSYNTTFIDDVVVASNVLRQLHTVSLIAVDIEGNLNRGGQLSLIQIAAELNTPIKTSVFIFDILKCPEIMTEGGLAALLATEEVMKVIHDCRKDAEALRYQHDVELASVFDTQVAYSMLADGPDVHLRRGLNVVLEKYAGVVNDVKNVVKHGPGVWEQRPLSQLLLSYAAQDVAYMLMAFREMFEKSKHRDLLDSICEESMRNVAYGLENSAPEVTSSETDVADTMSLLQDEPLGTSKYVQFSPNGSYKLSDEAFPPLVKQMNTIDTNSDRLADLYKLISILPDAIARAFYDFPLFEHTTEIVLDVGRRPLVRYVENTSGTKAMPLCSGELHCSSVSMEDLGFVCSSPDLGKFTTDNRAGLSSTLHRISQKLNRNNDTIGLTMRIGRMVQGSTLMIADIVASNRSVLLLGIPGVGKTTLLREYARVLASNHKRVEIVDTSNEIAGDGDIPHDSVGGARRMMVNKREEQHQVMIEAVQNHTPQSIIVDEIGTKREAAAAGDIAQRGVQIIATAHGTKLKDLLQSAQLNFLLGGVHTVVLGDEEARRRGLRSKSVRERLDAPVFDTVVELRSHHKWVIYHNVAEAVDCILEGKTDPVCEVRSQNVVTGDIQVTKTNSFDE